MTFCVNCLLCRQFTLNVKSYFLGKVIKHLKCHLLQFSLNSDLKGFSNLYLCSGNFLQFSVKTYVVGTLLGT